MKPHTPHVLTSVSSLRFLHEREEVRDSLLKNDLLHVERTLVDPNNKQTDAVATTDGMANLTRVLRVHDSQQIQLDASWCSQQIHGTAKGRTQT